MEKGDGERRQGGTWGREEGVVREIRLGNPVA